MGIRFYCANGHKLNVKSFLAGKKGICPHCGIKVEIPLHSTRESSRKNKKKSAAMPGQVAVPMAGSGGVPMARPAQSITESQAANVPLASVSGTAGNKPLGSGNQASPAPGVAATPGGECPLAPAPPTPGLHPQQGPPQAPGTRGGNPASGQYPSSPSAEAPVALAPQNQTAQPTATSPSQWQAAAPQQAPTTTAASSGMNSFTMGGPADPIAEAPQAVWYVRPKTGGQYGPAVGGMMQQWLDAGRVGPDSLVWREGWPQWKAASEVFARFGAPFECGSMAAQSGLPAGSYPGASQGANSAQTAGQGGSPGFPGRVAAPSTNLAGQKRQAERRRSLQVALGGIVIMSLALIVIITLLFYVLFSR